MKTLKMFRNKKETVFELSNAWIHNFLSRHFFILNLLLHSKQDVMCVPPTPSLLTLRLRRCGLFSSECASGGNGKWSAAQREKLTGKTCKHRVTNLLSDSIGIEQNYTNLRGARSLTLHYSARWKFCWQAKNQTVHERIFILVQSFMVITQLYIATTCTT